MKKNQPIEILILAILAVILIVFAANNYLIKPIKAQTAEVEKAVEQKELLLRATNASTLSYDGDKERLAELSKALSSLKPGFYPDSDEEVYLDHVSGAIKDNGMTFSSLSAFEGAFRTASVYPSEKGTKTILSVLSKDKLLENEKVLKPENFGTYVEGLNAKNGRFDKDIPTVTVTLSVEGDYNNVMKYLNDLTGKGKNVICNTMTLEIAENVSLHANSNPKVLVNVTLLFPGVPGISAYCDIAEPDPLPFYQFPEDILDGSYRNNKGFLYGLANLLAK